MERQQMASAEARQRVALQLALGVDLADALAASGEARRSTIRNLRRILERERLKGLRRHWSYDLNRHIALKQALELLAGGDRVSQPGERQAGKPSGVSSARREQRNGRHQKGRHKGAL
jgi:hypothetical protein